ncbi:MAG: VCBS repeat-containing protein, partial [bacterium]|nr:VCBS repeat-containing protein [bacterium]
NTDGSLDTSFDLINTLDGTPTFAEGGAAVVLDADAEIRDAELDALNSGNGDYDGASVTLSRNGGVSTEDAFSFTDGNGITLETSTSLNKTVLQKSGATIAIFDTTTIPGELRITFTNSGGQTPTSADVDYILQQITYANSSDAPPASAQIDWTFDDGNTGSQGTGGALQATGSTTVTITAVNDAPDFATISFTENIISTAADAAIYVTTVDVDGDGDVDVLSASHDDDKIAWYENDGAQNFTEHAISTAANGAKLVTTADVDGDGDMDVLSASEFDNKIAWYENDGSENFTERVISTGAIGASSVTTADVDGDGDMDVLSTSLNDDTIAWYENDGAQNFTAHTISTAANGAKSVTTADVDGDGDIDVLSASKFDNKITWYENDGAENFTAHTISTGANDAQSVTTADVDGDGDLDVLSASYGNSKIAWYENDGAENFTERVISTGAIGASSVSTADVDGDGDMDVLSTSHSDDKVAWYENDGAGNFTERVISTGADVAWQVATADVDSDGDLDVLSASHLDDKIAWYENTAVTTLDGAPTFTEDGAAVVLDADVIVSDAELDALNGGNGNYDGASVTLVRNGGASTEDVFSNSGLLGALTEAGSLVYNGTTIGTVTTNSGGTLVLSFNTNATSALVDSTLQSIAYSNSSDAPPASAQIDWSFDDGDAEQATGSTTVTITAVNDIPVITNLGGDALAYSEGDRAVVIEQGSDVVVADVDSTDFDTGTLTVFFAAGSDSAEDILAIRNQGSGTGEISVAGYGVAYEGTLIGSFTGGANGVDLVITLNANANPAAVQALIENITYENSDSDNATTGARTVRFVLSDGDGGTSADHDT